MDPLTALGLAANILQFVSVGHKLLSAAQEIGASSRGTMKEVDQYMALVADIRRKIKTQTLPAISDVSDEDKHVLGNVARECQDVAGTLMEKLSKLKATNTTGLRGKWQAVFVAGKYMWMKDEISGLKNRLFELESRLERWWESEQSLERNSSIQAKIDSLAHALGRLEAQSPNDQLKVLSSDLQRGFDDLKGQARRYEDLTQANSRRTTEELQRLRDETNALHESTLLDTMAMLERLAQEMKNVEKHERMIQSLTFSSIKTRQGTIPDAQIGTLQWLFDPGTTPFSQWLEKGQGVFWINGWAGSGKSTLMKFATSHLITHRHLQSWAQPSKLVTASHYFWTAGTAMQKSQQGLLQNLLHQLFRASPSLVDILCPDRPAGDAWDMDELRAAFVKLGRQTGLDTKFCLFIDGLDEFDGPEEDIIQIVKGLTEARHIKVCVSSRAWSGFLAEWGASKDTLKVHMLTKDDMDKYIRDLLGENGVFGRLAGSDDRYHQLISMISERAEGVWLWVYLVVRDLLRDIRDNESYDQLLVRLNSYPKELEDYFKDILRRIDKIHQGESAQIFLLAYHSRQYFPPSVLCLPHLSIPNDPNLALQAFNTPLRPATVEELDALCKTWEPRLQNRCRDLLKFQPGYDIRFLHRTVRDFMGGHLRELEERRPTGFDPVMFLAYLELIVIKRGEVPVDSGSQLDFFEHVEQLLHYAARVQDFSKHGTAAGVSLVEELDWTLSRMLGEYTPIYTDTLLLTLATHHGLTFYVKAKIKQCPGREKSFTASLLDIALYNDRAVQRVLEMFQRRFWREYEQPIPEMIKILLDSGADPNEPFPEPDTESPWQVYVGGGQAYIRDYGTRQWLSIVKILLEGGADPDVCSMDVTIRDKSLETSTRPRTQSIRLMEFLRTKLNPGVFAELNVMLDDARNRKLGRAPESETLPADLGIVIEETREGRLEAEPECVPEQQPRRAKTPNYGNTGFLSRVSGWMELLAHTLPSAMAALMMMVWWILPRWMKKDK